MAGVVQSAFPYHDVPCKRHPLLLLSIFVFLPLMDCKPLNGLRIDLMRKDSLLLPKMTSTESLKQAVRRSYDRLKRPQTISAVTNELQVGDRMKGRIEAPISAGNGEFLMNISIGTPSLPYYTNLDTGSDLIWTQCNPCEYCYKQPTPMYDPSFSSTYRKVHCKNSLYDSFSCYNATCKYGYAYGDSSFTKGILSYETFHLSSRTISHLAFVCGHNNSGVAFGEGAGLVGFGRGPLSLVSQLGTSRPNRFSYCLVPLNDSPSKTRHLFIGKDTKMKAGNVSSTAIIQSSLNPTCYYLSFEGISVNDKLLAIPSCSFDLQASGSGGLIIHSGTTVTYLKENAYDVVKEVLSSSTNLPRADGFSVGLDLCFQQGTSNSSFPTITFHFKGADFVLSKENYLFDIGNGVLCLTMLSNQGITGLSIFGNLQQQNYQILFDNDRNMLSFAPTVCGTL